MFRPTEKRNNFGVDYWLSHWQDLQLEWVFSLDKTGYLNAWDGRSASSMTQE